MWIVTIGFGICAGWLDLRTRRIPNWLTVSGLAVGLTANLIFGGWQGLRTSMVGAGVALGFLLPLVLMRGVGAGDWKLMGAVGSLMGWKPMVLILLAGFVISGIMAVIQVLLTRRVKATSRNMLQLVQGFVVFGLSAHPEISLDNPTLMKLPFGAALGMATVSVFIMSRWATNWQW
jgi:prepilin peptidase CpaA